MVPRQPAYAQSGVQAYAALQRFEISEQPAGADELLAERTPEHQGSLFAVAQKVEVRLADLDRQLQNQRARIEGHAANLEAYLVEVRNLVATTLAQLGNSELKARRPQDAEGILALCLKLREKTAPDHWTTFNTQSMLGESLVGQKKYAAAEPYLLAGYAGLKQREAKIPESFRMLRLTEAGERLVQLYRGLERKG